jgi:hypothetical protein
MRKRLSISCKRPITIANPWSYLTKDNMELRVTIGHIQCRVGFEPRLTFSARSLVACCHCNCQISMLISLPMHCFHCKLTSLISQALLQTALDKEERDLNGSVIQYEFSKLPAIKRPLRGNHRSNSSYRRRQ